MNIIKIHLSYNENLEDPLLCQQLEFEKIRKRYDLSNYEQFVNTYALSTFDDLRDELLRENDDVLSYIKTSGTTSRKKYVPICI